MNKAIVSLVIFLAMAIFALVNAASPTPVPEYKKSTGYKMGFEDGRNASGTDCLWMQAEFNRREKAWLHGDMSNNYLQGCLDSQNEN